MSHVTSTTTERPTDGAAASAEAGGAVLDLRDDLSSVRGIAASMVLSAPLWAGAAAAVVWWMRHNAV